MGTRTLDSRTPPKVRDFGFYPNIEDWRPGDLLLVEKTGDKPVVSQAIVNAQLTVYTVDDARWHHAGVYIGDGYLSEAVARRGVVYSPVHKYYMTHRIKVRRDMGLSERQRYELAIHSLTRLTEKYSWYAALLIGLKVRTGLWKPENLRSNSDLMICSRLYEVAYQAATRRIPVASLHGNTIMPADLSASPMLSTVQTCWRKLARA